MTTALNKALRREASDGIHSGGKFRHIIIELQPPSTIGFRLKGTRRTYYLPVKWCFIRAAEMAHNAEKAARKKERELRRKARG